MLYIYTYNTYIHIYIYIYIYCNKCLSRCFSRKRRTFLGIDPIFVSVPSSLTGDATVAGGSVTSSACHYGTCIVHHEDVDTPVPGHHGSLPAAVFCMGSSLVRHQQQQQQQQQRASTLSSSSVVTYGIVPCAILSATSSGDGDVAEDDEEPDDLRDGSSTEIGTDFGVQRHVTLQDNIRFCGGDDRYYGKITTASNFRNGQECQSRWILPPTPDLTAAVPPPSLYGPTSASVGYRCVVPCHSCIGFGRRESLSPSASSSTSTCYGLLRLHQQRAVTAVTTDDEGPSVGSHPGVQMSERHRLNSSTMPSNRYDEGLGLLDGGSANDKSHQCCRYKSPEVN